jgi:hypothetical protein
MIWVKAAEIINWTGIAPDFGSARQWLHICCMGALAQRRRRAKRQTRRGNLFFPRPLNTQIKQATALKVYYEMMGWDEHGIPNDSKLQALELEWIT